MKQNFKALLSILLCMLLLVSMVSCAEESKKTEEPAHTVTATETETAQDPAEGEVPAEGLWEAATYRKDMTFGEGEKKVEVEVKAGDESITFTIHTDKEDLGSALLEHKLVEGEESAYGLYIKKVNGITADYDADQSYWSFCKGGEMQMVGVSETRILGGEHFELVYTK